ncbi:mitochondrial trans-2-enoyl-CoA reductase [Fistulifera solaris]|jgi:trans-2-enoyl-CoA reductase|uniref:Mitochondrial trans-2-enoyl-CoA reductase n=1 Tax=Fistulifera solaris TaxID=1519565 RepID=A0A1Z5JVK0_FISSO|nr:mitochondrial trans-2-enoyl-CoA reductase [Fistulifera solaris]|eukprot:GAX18067.1 mitochondrial trans-2-enoyl-CoA reductase [Fistulifera solaris]
MLRKRNKLFYSTSIVGKRRFYHELSFAQHGDPLQVLQYHEEQPSQLENRNHVTVEMKYAAWNPADINQVQGKYPSLASPSWRKSSVTQRNVAGAEGIGVVVHVSELENDDSSNKKVKVGDTVITIGGIGTFRSHVSLPFEYVLPVFPKQPHSQQHTICPHDAIFFQLVGTAYNLLKQGNTNGSIVQNAGNSAAATVLAQMTQAPIVSFVRQRSNQLEMDFLHDYITSTCHAKILFEDEYIHDRNKVRALREEWNFQTAFNTVGGPSSQLLLQLLQPNGWHVTYGGMSQQPVSVATSDLIFRNVQLKGYWHSQWMWQQSYESRVAFVKQLVRDYYDSSPRIQLPPVQVFALRDWTEALRWEKAQTGPIRSKVVFDLSLE